MTDEEDARTPARDFLQGCVAVVILVGWTAGMVALLSLLNS